MESDTGKLKAIVIGATGATGRELVDILLKSKEYDRVTVLVRRTIDRWEKLNEEEKKKFNLIKVDQLDVLSNKEEMDKLLKDDTKFDTLFCTLGSRVGYGEKEFTKVDYEYVVLSAELCEKYNIPHLSLLSSMGVDENSMFLYTRTKGKADNECLKKNIRNISIFRPGVIKNRDDARFGEKLLKFVPFVPKIDVKDLAYAMFIESVTSKNLENTKTIYKNDDIVKLSQNKKL